MSKRSEPPPQKQKEPSAVNIPFLRRRGAAGDVPVVITPVQQPSDMNDENRQMLRTLAQIELETAIAMRDRIMTEMITSLRWVQTSLLVVNGGAALATVQSDALAPITRTWAGAFFIVGIVLSLLAPVVSAKRNEDVPRKMTEMVGYWASVTVDFLRSEEIERDWKLYGQSLARRSKLPRSISYAAVVAFIIGCVIIGAGNF